MDELEREESKEEDIRKEGEEIRCTPTETVRNLRNKIEKTLW